MRGRTVPRKRWIAAALGLGGLAVVACHEAPPWLATRRLADVAWMRSATAAERRMAAHLVLGSWMADAHDAVLVLSQAGDQSSIPYLRAYLARHPDGDDDVVSCSWTHARKALDRLEARARPRRP